MYSRDTYDHSAYEVNRDRLLCVCVGGGGGAKTQYLHISHCLEHAHVQFHLVYILSVQNFGRTRLHFEHNEDIHSSFNKTRRKHGFYQAHLCPVVFSYFPWQGN